MKWKLRTYDDIDYDNIDIDSLLKKMLIYRGIQNPEIWLNVSKENENNPSLLKNINEAVEIIHNAVVNTQKIYIQVDSDVDGFTSAAILYNFINEISNCNIRVGIHEGKEHGLSLQEALKEHVDLVLVPDASGDSNDYKILKEKGIKSIIIDHHDYEEKNFDTVIVNCNYDPYPNKSLSGAGVSLKVCQYYCQKYDINYNFNNLYGLASVGMVADVMNLQEVENQYIIREGLNYLKNHNFFNELLKDRMGNPVKNVTLKDIGWSIGPNMNAIIRLGSIEDKVLLFNTLISPNSNINSKKRGANEEVVPIYQEMCRICKNLKARQNRMVQNALKIIEPSLNLNHNLIYYIDEDNLLPFELSGLIANKLLSLYKRPVLLLKHFHDYIDESQPDCWAGSMRSISTDGFEDPRAIFNNMTGVREFSGHSLASGSKIYKEGFDGFLAEAYSKLDKLDFNNQLYIVEASFSYYNFNIDVGKLFASEYIWGSGIEKPLIRITDIDCINAQFMGKEENHIKITTPKFDIIIFDNENLTKILKQSKKYTINIIGEVSWNEWEGKPKLQIIVNDYDLIEKKSEGWTIYDF